LQRANLSASGKIFREAAPRSVDEKADFHGMGVAALIQWEMAIT
jgi:hypothetical protein